MKVKNTVERHCEGGCPKQSRIKRMCFAKTVKQFEKVEHLILDCFATLKMTCYPN